MFYFHVNLFRAVKPRKTSILMHLRIISAESDKIYRSQIKILVCQAGFVFLRFERPVEVAQMKTTHSLRDSRRVKKTLALEGKS